MSDRVNGFVVILDKDYRDDDIEATIRAIEQIKGVVKVKPSLVAPSDYIAKEQVKIEISNKLYDFAQQILSGEK